jgi:hypothetical protein
VDGNWEVTGGRTRAAGRRCGRATDSLTLDNERKMSAGGAGGITSEYARRIVGLAEFLGGTERRFLLRSPGSPWMPRVAMREIARSSGLG